MVHKNLNPWKQSLEIFNHETRVVSDSLSPSINLPYFPVHPQTESQLKAIKNRGQLLLLLHFILLFSKLSESDFCLKRWVIRVEDFMRTSPGTVGESINFPFWFLSLSFVPQTLAEKLNDAQWVGIINYAIFLNLCLLQRASFESGMLSRSQWPWCGVSHKSNLILNYSLNFPSLGFLLIYFRVVGSNCAGISCPRNLSTE